MFLMRMCLFGYKSFVWETIGDRESHWGTSYNNSVGELWEFRQKIQIN